MPNISMYHEIYKKTINKDYGFYVFCDIFAKLVEPYACFNEKVYEIIQDYYQYFVLDNTEEQLFLLETAPRTGKSLLTTILGSVFVGLRNPQKYGLIITSNTKTMKDFFGRILLIIQSPFFLQITGYNKKDFKYSGSNFIEFPNGFKLKFQSTQSETPIGQGFNFIWLDDFLTYEDTISEARSYHAETKLTSILTRRMYNLANKKLTGTKIMVANQRLNFNDVSARFINSYTNASIPFIHLTLPYHFKIQGKTEYKLYNGKIVHFDNTDFLRNVFSDKDENRIKADLHNDARFMTEYLQIPTQADVQIFDISKLNYYDTCDNIHNITFVFITADIAFKVNKKNDYTAIVVWGVDLQDASNPKLYALEIIHHKKILEETVQILIELYNNWKNFSGTNKFKSRFLGLLLEDVTSNEGLFMELSRERNIIYKKLSRSSNDKVARANLISKEFHKGVVYLPAFHKHTLTFQNEIRQFSRNNMHQHDDLVDCLIDAIHWGIKEQTGTTLQNFIEGIKGFTENTGARYW